ncbi:MAG TPA: TIM barrel protein, partial [Pirellulales bacterium]|nr:TIM barrel protein [Pirellulales bacterium]
MHARLSRRRLLGSAAVAGAAAPLLSATSALSMQGTAATKGRVKQSLVFWCFNVTGDKWDIDRTCQVARELGCVSVELTGPEHWETLKKYGLTCAIAPNGMRGAPFMRGFNNPAYHDEVIARTKHTIDACAAAGVPSVIAFTGYKWRKAEDPTSGEISLEEGREHCIKGLKQLAPYAEQKGVTICLEHLNTRDDTHPMKGHP